jgi:predicted nucleotidyltransferase component of viral defense system
MTYMSFILEMMMESQEIEDLYKLQEGVLHRLYNLNDSQIMQSKLCGGTALARCFLNHRISYDLDFFIPHGFKAMDLSMALKQGGFDYEIKDLVDDSNKANQLHTYINHDNKILKVSFVEDAYFELYPRITKPFGTLEVFTEGIDGLYHRKLRTVSGSTDEGEQVVGGRQKARDLFDLFVLAKDYKSIQEFFATLPYQFPVAAFNNGLASMPWYELMDEFTEIVCDSKYNDAKNVDYIQNALFDEIGANLLIEAIQEEKVEIKVKSIKKSKGLIR